MVDLIRITKESGIPLIGLIHIGVEDRGSNLLQVRATTACNMKCTFCSTSANSTLHPYNYTVELDYLIETIKEVIKLKDGKVREINIDSVGEPTTYPELVELVKQCKNLPEIEFVSMQTNGTLLNKNKIMELEKVGLGRINLSIHSLNKETGKSLFGNEFYDLDKILENIKLIYESKIELNLTPVWLPNVNDEDIKELIKFSKENNYKISIQKYESTKYSRKEKKAKEINWYKFYKQLEVWETEFNLKLKIGPNDMNIHRTPRIPLILNRDEIVPITITMPGWMKNEMIGTVKGRSVTILNSNAKVGQIIRAKVTNTKNSIYLVKKV